VVRQAAGDERVVRVTGSVELDGVIISAPIDRPAFATADALIATLTEGQSTTSFGLPAAGQVQSDGSVVLTKETSLGVQMRAEIAAPWAKDATGRSLPTWYVLDSSGRFLTQHVDTEGAVFPVAADPRLTYGWGVYLNVTGAEAKAIGTAAVALGGGLNIAICAGKGLPLVIGRLAAILCTVVGGASVLSIIKSIVSLWRAGGSTSNNTCYQKRIVGPSTGWYRVALRNCTG
jgi:hypothetical protein